MAVGAARRVSCPDRDGDAVRRAAAGSAHGRAQAQRRAAGEGASEQERPARTAERDSHRPDRGARRRSRGARRLNDRSRGHLELGAVDRVALQRDAKARTTAVPRERSAPSAASRRACRRPTSQCPTADDVGAEGHDGLRVVGQRLPDPERHQRGADQQDVARRAPSVPLPRRAAERRPGSHSRRTVAAACPRGGRPLGEPARRCARLLALSQTMEEILDAALLSPAHVQRALGCPVKRAAQAGGVDLIQERR